MYHLPVNPTLAQLIRAGAMGRALKRIHAGWRDDAIILALESAYPGAEPHLYLDIVSIAHQAVNAAAKQNSLAPGQRLNIDDIPLVPPL